jgi:hypothetical protein
MSDLPSRIASRVAHGVGSASALRVDVVHLLLRLTIHMLV